MNDKEFLNRLVQTFKLSPFWGFMGFEIDSLQVGEVQIHLELRDELLNLTESLHGGVYAALLDAAMGLSVRTVSEGSPTVTLNLNVHYLKTVSDGVVICTSRIINQGKSIITAEGNIKDKFERKIAFATGTFKILKAHNC